MSTGIEIISGFDQKENELLDKVRGKVADEAARLAIRWVAPGLLTFQEDTGETYQYVGIPPSNLVGDWILFTAEGATGPTGADGADGVDGDKYATVSTDSFAIPETHPTTVGLTVGLNLAYTAGQPIIIVADLANNFNATVISYDSGTGALSVESTSHLGTGTFANWQVNLAGTQGIQGNALLTTKSDITLDEAEVINVEGGVWTPIAPYTASVFNDARSNFTQPPQLNGSMTDHSITYDGTSWFDNGVWRGPTGAAGIQGSDGDQGIQGIQGDIGLQGLQGDDGVQGVIGPEGPAGSDATVTTYEELFVSVPTVNLAFKSGDAVLHNVLITATNTNVIVNLPSFVGQPNTKDYSIVITGFINHPYDITINTADNKTFYASFFPSSSISSGVLASFSVKQYTQNNQTSSSSATYALRFSIDAGGNWAVTGGAAPNVSEASVIQSNIGDTLSSNTTNYYKTVAPKYSVQRLVDNSGSSKSVMISITGQTICEAWNATSGNEGWVYMRVYASPATTGTPGTAIIGIVTRSVYIRPVENNSPDKNFQQLNVTSYIELGAGKKMNIRVGFFSGSSSPEFNVGTVQMIAGVN